MDCYFQIGFGLFPDFFDKLENVLETYPGHVPDILKTYSKHGQNISQICQNICQKCPGHIQHVSRTFQQMSQTLILGKIDFDKNEFGKNRILKNNRVSCMVHQVFLINRDFDKWIS